MIPKISIIIPLYNEEQVFEELEKRLTNLAQKHDFEFEFILVDDGSADSTPALMEKLSLSDNRFKSVFLSRNFGHQIAVSAGMASVSNSDAIMIIDGDLQDPPELVADFYDQIKAGYDVVYAIRKKRKENWIKKISYWMFYRILNSISTINIPLDSGDFCMISKRVNDEIALMPERSRFIRGMRTWVGFRQIGIEYERNARFAGEAKYGFKMLFKLAYDGIFNFSEVPLRLITKLGFIVVSLSILYILFVLITMLTGKYVPQGFLSTIIAISLFSGVQLICLGVIGEYLSRIYEQVKGRPLYIIKKNIDINKQ
jgi:glycosyltransferase involved in cell wall biosynthesis